MADYFSTFTPRSNPSSVSKLSGGGRVTGNEVDVLFENTDDVNLVTAAIDRAILAIIADLSG